MNEEIQKQLNEDAKLRKLLSDPNELILTLNVLAAEMSRSDIRKETRKFVLALDRAVEIIRASAGNKHDK
jgi:hypothetical protein